MDKFKEIMSVEQNSFADERFSRNGGGYLQPHIIYDYQGEKVELFDNNTGEYGNEYTVVYDGCEFWYSTKGKDEEVSTSFAEKHNQFINDWNEAFGRNYPIWNSHEEIVRPIREEILYQSVNSTPEPGAFATYAIEDGDGGYISVSVSEDDFVEAMGYETIEDYQDGDYDEFLWKDKGYEILTTLARKRQLL